MRLYKRECTVIVGGTAYSGLRSKFAIKKDLTKEPNSGKVSLYNLSEDTRAKLKDKGERLIIEAGYEGTSSQIFAGEIRQIDHTREGANWVTDFHLGDGERAYRYAFASETFAPGIRKAEVFRFLARTTGLDINDALSLVDSYTDQFQGGYVVHGKTSTELDRIVKALGLEWSVQDGKMQVLRKGVAAQSSALYLSPESGLIGSPAHGTPKKGTDGVIKSREPAVLVVKALLSPSARPGSQVRVESSAVKGYYRITSVQHTGDTHGGDWYSELEAEPL